MNAEEVYKEIERDIKLSTIFIEVLGSSIHKLNRHWWDFDENGIANRNKGEAIALMHSELSEALEGVRKNKMDEHISDLSSEVVEMADVIIRILDYCAGFNLPIGEALRRKIAYNVCRADHKLENRMQEGGKKF